MITNQTIDEIFHRARIEEVVSDFMSLKRRGANFLGLCPFHNERTPSFIVSPVKNIYKCFGCGKSGTPVGFIMDHENLSYVEALKYLAQKYNVPIIETNVRDEEVEERNVKESMFLVNEFAALHYTKNMIESEYGRNVGLSYFKSRGFNENTISRFNLGYALPQGTDLLITAKNNAYNPDLLKELGLVTQQDKDFFINRVMFPIHNLSGKIAGFGGRALTINDKVPKYLNSPESPIYSKSKILYGFYQSKNQIRKENNCILVEGYTDVLAMHQAGIELAVASSGTSLTQDQASLIRRFSENVTLLFDGDSAGVKAAIRGIDILLSENLNVFIVVLPDKDDPDSFLQKHGSSGLQQFIDHNKKDFILFKTDGILQEAKNDPIKKVSLIQNIIQSIACIPDRLKRTVYISTCSTLLDISETVIQSEVSKAMNVIQDRLRVEKSRITREENNRPELAKSQKESIKLIENKPFQDIIKALILFGDRVINEQGLTLCEYVKSELIDDEDYFDHPLYTNIFKEYFDRLVKGISNHIDYYLNHPDSDVRNLVINWIDPGYIYSENWLKKYNSPLQYQPMPEDNFFNELQSAIVLFKINLFNQLIMENMAKLNVISNATDGDLMTLQLHTQTLINLERQALSDKLGLVVHPKK